MEVIIDKLILSNRERTASFLKILGIIFLAIASGYIIGTFSAKWVAVLLFVLLVGLFLLLGLKNLLFILILLRINLDSLHSYLNISLGEYKTMSLPSALGILIFFIGLAYLLSRKIELWKIPVVRSFTFFFAACVLSFLFSGGSLNTLSELMELASFVLLYIMTIGILQKEEDIKKLVNVLILSSLIPLAVGFIQLFTQLDITQTIGYEPSFRLISTAPHCNVYAFYLVMLSILVTSVFWQEKSDIKRKGLFVLLGLLIVSLIFTYSRGAWIILISGIFVLGILRHRKLLFLAPLCVISAIFLYPPILQRFAPLLDPDLFIHTSLAWRLNLWILSITYFLQHPLFGIGFGNYIFAQYEIMAIYVGAHNDYLRILVETGILGFSCFIWMLMSMLKTGIKAYKKWNNPFYKNLCLGFLALWVAFVLIRITGNLFNLGTIQWYFWTYAAVVARLFMGFPADVSNVKEEIR